MDTIYANSNTNKQGNFFLHCDRYMATLCLFLFLVGFPSVFAHDVTWLDLPCGHAGQQRLLFPFFLHCSPRRIALVPVPFLPCHSRSRGTEGSSHRLTGRDGGRHAGTEGAGAESCPGGSFQCQPPCSHVGGGGLEWEKKIMGRIPVITNNHNDDR